jgi:hypothetical protein
MDTMDTGSPDMKSDLDQAIDACPSLSAMVASWLCRHEVFKRIPAWFWLPSKG